MRDKVNSYSVWWLNVKEETTLNDIGLNVIIILKWFF
jgi:hypothetical protein